MDNFCDYFKGKKITVMGLGLLGRGIRDVAFLAKCGADLTVTDLKNSNDLKKSLNKLKKFRNIEYVLGEHRLQDFENKDFILRAPNAPLDSIYLAHARKNKIPIEMDESLFAKLSDAILVGVTGTRGKTTTTTLIYEILKKYEGKYLSRLDMQIGKVYLAGNILDTATLPLVSKIKKNDICVLELSSWQLQGFAENMISPRVAVFTNFMKDHLNYYKGDMDLYWKDKSAIFKFQSDKDFLFVSESVGKIIKDRKEKVKSNFNIVKSKIPHGWKLKVLGEHNLRNISLAVAVAKSLGVSDSIIKKVVESFSGVSGRMELLGKKKGILFYNDTTSTTPDALGVALKTLGEKYSKGKIVLIAGGADKELDYGSLPKIFKEFVKGVVLFKGVASDKILTSLQKSGLLNLVVQKEIASMKVAFQKALEIAKRGDVVLLSPGAASFGIFKNEFDRGGQFLKLYKNLT